MNARIIEETTEPRLRAPIPRAAPPADPREPSMTLAPSVSPGRRLWLRFKSRRLGYCSLIVFAGFFALSLAGELVSNSKPLVVRYDHHWYFPLMNDYPEAVFGGNLPIRTDYLDPFIRGQFKKPGNFALYPPNHFYYDTINYYATERYFPAAPSRENWLGTDIIGYDIVARLLYGFRSSVLFALALTLTGTLFGVLIGSVQGFFAGRTDLICQRLIEIWGAMPELYLIIIFASIFQHGLVLLFILLSLFGWIYLSHYVRAEFLRNRQLDYVKAARAMGLPNWQIMWRHVLPNSLTPVITFLPFRMSAAILALTSLDFLGLGVTSPDPSLGELLQQGKGNLDAWWISFSTFSVLAATLLLLTFIGDALRDSLDARSHGRPAADNG